MSTQEAPRRGHPSLNRPIKIGDRIQTVIRLTNGGSWLGTINTVKYVSSDGTPIVRHRHGKVDKPVNEWIIPRANE